MAVTLDPDTLGEQLCSNSFGYFRDSGKEFVITNLATPMPWTNVMSNGRYGVVISQSGGGFSFGDNSQTARVTRWDQDLVVDRQGRFIYIQDLDRPEDIWSTTLQPTGRSIDTEEVVHGLGYTTYSRVLNEIETQHTVFVPQTDRCEVWILKLKNLGTRARKLRLASYLEWHLGNSADWHREFHRLFYHSGSERTFLHARKLPGLQPDSRVIEDVNPIAFHGANGFPVEHWIADKASFLGRPADIGKPGFLLGHKPDLQNPRWNDPIGSAVGGITLAPGEERTVTFITGSVDTIDEARQLVANYTPEKASAELSRVTNQWAELCEKSHFETGDEAFDLMNNYWLKYQTLGCRMLARCAYYQQGGAYGFRDQLQDSLGMLSLDPQITREQIIRHAEATYEDGGVRHWWHPDTNIFAVSHHSDTCLWVPYAVLAYLDETNDTSILDVSCRYLSRETETFGSAGSLLEHVFTGIDRTLSKLSPRGLPLLFSGDWNDGLSHAGVDGKGESVWLGMFLYDVLNRWVPVLGELGMSDLADQYSAAKDALKKAVDEYGWDGDWFIQGTRDDGLPLGSSNCEEGKIFLNVQTWALISGIAPADRADQAMEAVRKHLVKPYGALLLAPAFSKADPFVGYITRYAPGLRENGGVYSHASTWAVQALAMAGLQDEAIKLYKAMIPCNGRSAERYVAEPYVMPGNIDGPDSPFEGKAGWTWYTGSSAWMNRIALDWICGIRATRDGLLVAPKSGSSPIHYKVKRQYRGDAFEFEITGQGESAKIECDTARLVGGKLQSTGTGAKHRVIVTLS